MVYLTFQSIAEQVDLLAQRDNHREAVARQVGGAMQDLFDRLHAHVDGLSDRKLLFSTLAMRSAAERIVRQWANEQLDVASVLTRCGAGRELGEMPQISKLDREVRERVSEALPAFAGIGLIAGSIGIIPFAVSFVTVTTGVWIFSSTTINLPLLGIAAVGIGIAMLLGGLAFDSFRNRMRTNFKYRLERAAERQVLGVGADPDARCVLSDIQDMVAHSGNHPPGRA